MKLAMTNGVAKKQAFMASDKLTVQDQMANMSMHRSYGNWNKPIDNDNKIANKDLKRKA